jgi:capsid protein
MKILNFFKRKETVKEPAAYYDYSNLRPLFDGEKTPYELGTSHEYGTDYHTLRRRSWEAYLKTDIAHNVIKKYCLWIVGSGLKLQSEPVESILKDAKINTDLSQFTDRVEDNFRLWANSKNSAYSQSCNLHKLADNGLRTALLSGDCLVIVRYQNKRVNVEIKDGFYVRTPIMSEHLRAAKERGNDIVNGVEVDATGKNIAFYVYDKFLKYTRVPAYTKQGILQAWLFKGMTFKPDDLRGLALFTAVLETLDKMDRYKDATLGAAEENAKIPYTIEHNQFSDGENPMLQNIASAFGNNKGVAPEQWTSAEGLAPKIAQTTNKQVYNMPIGSTVKRHAGSSDINFSGFFNPNLEIVCAVVGIPPEVAMDKFGGAYSGSRAALKSWEYKMLVDRTLLLKDQFYKPIFDFWLNIQILENRIDAQGYLTALIKDDYMVLESYRNCRFIGVSVPHIDPVKEANAERIKLGKSFDYVPLTTAEQACENLNSADFKQLIIKAKNEKMLSSDFDDSQSVSDDGDRTS